jgi:hypothetical protein
VDLPVGHGGPRGQRLVRRGPRACGASSSPARLSRNAARDARWVAGAGTCRSLACRCAAGPAQPRRSSTPMTTGQKVPHRICWSSPRPLMRSSSAPAAPRRTRPAATRDPSPPTRRNRDRPPSQPSRRAPGRNRSAAHCTACLRCRSPRPPRRVRRPPDTPRGFAPASLEPTCHSQISCGESPRLTCATPAIRGHTYRCLQRQGSRTQIAPRSWPSPPDPSLELCRKPSPTPRPAFASPTLDNTFGTPRGSLAHLRHPPSRHGGGAVRRGQGSLLSGRPRSHVGSHTSNLCRRTRE